MIEGTEIARRGAAVLLMTEIEHRSQRQWLTV